MSEFTKALNLKNSGPYKYFVPTSIGGVISKAMEDGMHVFMTSTNERTRA
jgi:hypothetical protein